MKDVTPQRGKSEYRRYMDKIKSLDDNMHMPTASVMLKFDRRGMFANYAEYMEWVKLSSSIKSRVWGDEASSDYSGRVASKAQECAARCLSKFRLSH